VPTSTIAAPGATAPASSPASSPASGPLSRLGTLLTLERDRWFLWTPVFLGVGIGLYFSLEAEPWPWLGPLAASGLLLATAALWRAGGERHRPKAIAVLALALIAAGFTAATVRTHVKATQSLTRSLGPTLVAGQVVLVEAFPDSVRVTLEDLSEPRFGDRRASERVRLKLGGSQPAIRPGDRIQVRAMLSPPPAPALPGAFDFQRHAYFLGLGAVGYAVGRADVVQPGRGEDGGGGFALAMARLRAAVGERVRARIEGDTGAVVVAFLLGEQTGISPELMTAIRDSGLAHLLSISGLHIGLAAGIIFFSTRLLLAAVPWLALRLPVKKLAAVAALAGAGFYTLLAGAPITAQRSFLMLAIVLVAILVDRRALSMRLVGWAAIVILLTAPETMLGPSFQMSFAAVVAIIAVYEEVKVRRGERDERPSWLGRSALYLLSVALTTLAAGTATTPFALYHFNRFTLYGVAANLVAVPLTGFWIMPWAVLAMILMPLGLEGLALGMMASGVDWVLWAAKTVAAWPGAVTTLPTLPVWGLSAIALGGLWFCLWRRRWRAFGLAGIALGALSASIERPPDVIVEGRGKLIAVRGADGGLLVSSRQAAPIARETWLRRRAEESALLWPRVGTSADGSLACDPLGCLYRAGDRTVAFVRDRAALDDDCRVADILVMAEGLVQPCPSAARIIDGRALDRFGAHALWLDGARIRIATVNGARGNRPWVTATAADEAD
jgi:competence protein ComEC